MANNFKEWIDSSQISTTGATQNIFDAATFNDNNSQRYDGFKSGTLISSLYVNTALRQANLVIAALMDLVNDSALDLTSSLNDVKTGLSNYLTTLNVASATKATEDEDNNNIKNTYAKQNGTYNTLNVGSAQRIAFTTTAPTASPDAGTLLIYVGTSLPSTQYDRVLYLITN